MAELGRLAEGFPEFWQLSDVTQLTQAYWLQRIAPNDLIKAEALRREAEQLRQSLGGPAADPLEQLLIERIVATRLHVLHADLAYARATGLTVQQVGLYLKRMDRAQHRYLAAIKTLAQVRRLLVPMVQVNIAQHQVNVVAPHHGGMARQ